MALSRYSKGGPGIAVHAFEPDDDDEEHPLRFQQGAKIVDIVNISLT